MQAGFRKIMIPFAEQRIPLGLYYPSTSEAQTIRIGAYSPTVAMDGVATESVKGLILMAHGIDGNELSHAYLAQRLAQQGYLVAAPHCVADDLGAFFVKMAPLLKHVLGYVSTDAEWSRKNPSGNIGVIAHSAGAAGALPLLGGVLDPIKITSNYGIAGDGLPNEDVVQFKAAAAAFGQELVDPGIGGVILMAPLAGMFEPSSLARIKARIRVYTAGSDGVLDNQDHGNWLRAQIQNAEFKECKNAGHFSFCAPHNRDVSVGKTEFPSVFGGLGEFPGKAAFFADPPGFDRAAFHQRLESEVAGFFDFYLS